MSNSISQNQSDATLASSTEIKSIKKVMFFSEGVISFREDVYILLDFQREAPIKIKHFYFSFEAPLWYPGRRGERDCKFTHYYNVSKEFDCKEKLTIESPLKPCSMLNKNKKIQNISKFSLKDFLSTSPLILHKYSSPIYPSGEFINQLFDYMNLHLRKELETILFMYPNIFDYCKNNETNFTEVEVME